MAVRRISRTRQPDSPAGINWGHPRTRGLCFFAPLGDAHGFRDLARPHVLTRTGLASAASVGGVKTKLFGSGSYCDFTRPADIGADTPFTLAWTQYPISASADGTIINCNFGTAGVHYSFIVYLHLTDASYYFTAGPRAASAAVQWGATVGAIANGRLDRFVLTAAAGSQSLTRTDYELYRNGVLVPRDGTSASYGATLGAIARIGAIESGSATWDGGLLDMRMWRRVLAPAEAAAESQISRAAELYAPLELRRWPGFAAAASAITLQSDGSLLYKPNPAGSDNKLYLTTAGAIAAKTAPGAGDRRISLSGGNWLAS